MSILQGTDKTGISGKVPKHLPLNDIDAENPQTPADPKKEAATKDESLKLNPGIPAGPPDQEGQDHE